MTTTTETFRSGRVTDEMRLVERLCDGDPLAQEQFVRRHIGSMLTTARRYFRCGSDVDDAVQDAFISAFRAIKSFGGQSTLATWLHRITVNACLMRLRSAARHAAAESIQQYLPAFDASGHHARRIQRWRGGAELMHAGTVHDRAAVEETRAKVREAIDRLPETYRTVLLLRDIEELDTAETARLLGCTPGNVKTRLHRARQTLRSLVEPLFAELGGH